MSCNTSHLQSDDDLAHNALSHGKQFLGPKGKVFALVLVVAFPGFLLAPYLAIGFSVTTPTNFCFFSVNIFIIKYQTKTISIISQYSQANVLKVNS